MEQSTKQDLLRIRTAYAKLMIVSPSLTEFILSQCAVASLPSLALNWSTPPSKAVMPRSSSASGSPGSSHSGIPASFVACSAAAEGGCPARASEDEDALGGFVGWPRSFSRMLLISLMPSVAVPFEVEACPSAPSIAIAVTEPSRSRGSAAPIWPRVSSKTYCPFCSRTRCRLCGIRSARRTLGTREELAGLSSSGRAGVG